MTIKQFTFNPFQENTYIIICEETRQCAIVDCGVLFAHEEEQLKQYIADNNLTVTHVLNTHLHLDHCFGNAWTTDTYGVKPAAHQDDEEMLEQMQSHAASYGLPVEVRVQKLGSYLTDGQIIKIGIGTLKVICTPGHSKGGVCFYAENEAFLLSGDTLFAQSIGRTDLPGGSHANLIRSVQQNIFTLPENVRVYPGHGSYTTIGEEKVSNPFF